MLLQSLPPLCFRFRLHSNLKEGLLILALPRSLPPLAVQLSRDLSALPTSSEFSFSFELE